jgi:hypothetical protein
MNTTWTPVLGYTDESAPEITEPTPEITVNLVCHHRSRRAITLVWCLRALCWLTRTDLVLLEM